MGLMGGIFKALGFESETKPKNKAKKVKTKATYKLKDRDSERVDEIDGVPVYYPENLEQLKDFTEFVKQKKAIIISIEGCESEVGKRILDYLRGFAYGSNSKFIVLNEDRLYLILPEGMEVEE